MCSILKFIYYLLQVYPPLKKYHPLTADWTITEMGHLLLNGIIRFYMVYTGKYGIAQNTCINTCIILVLVYMGNVIQYCYNLIPYQKHNVSTIHYFIRINKIQCQISKENKFQVFHLLTMCCVQYIPMLRILRVLIWPVPLFRYSRASMYCYDILCRFI